MEDKYNRLGSKGKYVISVVNFCIGLSAEKFLFKVLPVIENDLPILMASFVFYRTIPTIFLHNPLHNLMVNNLI